MRSRFRDVLTLAIRFIINLSIRRKIFPDSWKYGVITCLPKKGCLLQPKNWRPINLLCILSKTLEMSMNYQWKSYMETWEHGYIYTLKHILIYYWTSYHSSWIFIFSLAYNRHFFGLDLLVCWLSILKL